MSSSEQRRASSRDERRDVGAGAQDRAVDLLHHVEGRVVHRDVVAERERLRHRHVGGVRARSSTVYSRAMSCAVGSTWPSGGRRSTHSLRAVADGVREVRAAARDERRGAAAPPVAPSTCAANHGRRRSRSTPGGVSVTAGRLQIRRSVAGLVRRGCAATRCGTRGRDGLAVAARVAGDPADGHVDAEAGGGALLFGLARPRSRTRGARGPSRGTRAAPGTRGRPRGPATRARRGPRDARRRARRTGASGPGRRLRPPT